jgi:hypothetical protein
MNWYGIAALRFLGLAWDIKLQKPLSELKASPDSQPRLLVARPVSVVEPEVVNSGD